MRLVENLRNAEKKGATAIRRSMERVREEWADAERRLRQRMRIYPQKSRAVAAAAPHSAGAILEVDENRDPEKDNTAPKPIVSVHGHDVAD